MPEDGPVRTSAGAGVGAPTPAPNPSKASMNKVPVVAQEFVDNWSDSTWLTDERIQALRPEDLRRSDHASFVVAAGNNWGFSTGGPGDSVYEREVTLFNKVVSASGRKVSLE